MGKRDNAVHSLNEFFGELEAIFSVQLEPTLLEATFSQIESKYRGVKKQLEAIADRLVEDGLTAEDERTVENLTVGSKIKTSYLKIAQKYAGFQKGPTPLQNTSHNFAVLGEVVDAVKQMAESIASKPKVSGLERLSVLTCMGLVRVMLSGKKSSTTG